LFISLNIPRILETKVGLQQHLEDANEYFLSKLKAMPTQSLAYPTAMSLFTFAMVRTRELFFAPCDQLEAGAVGDLVNDTLRCSCEERKFALPNSNPRLLKSYLLTGRAQQLEVSVSDSAPSESEIDQEIEFAGLSLLWARWRSTTRRPTNTAFIYSFSPSHYRGLVRSRDFFSGLRTPERSTNQLKTFSSTYELQNHVDVSLLLGYLQRRFLYAGKYLKIGCRITVEKNEFVDLDAFSSVECVDDEEPTLSTISNVNLTAVGYLDFLVAENNKLKESGDDRSEFDLIYVDGIHSSSVVSEQVALGSKLLSPNGIIIVSNAR
jgi:hypothetical protein